MAKSLPLDAVTVCVVTPCLIATAEVPNETGAPVTVSAYQLKVMVPDRPLDVTTTEASTVMVPATHAARSEVTESITGDVVAVAEAEAVVADGFGLAAVVDAGGVVVVACTALWEGEGVGVALVEGVSEAAATDSAAATDGVTCVVAPMSDAGLAFAASTAGAVGEW